MRKAIYAMAATGILAASGTGIAAADSSAALPPECVSVSIQDPGSLQIAYTKWCGTGNAGENPITSQIGSNGPVIFDGTTSIDPASCPKLNPCIILWPKSPAS